MSRVICITGVTSGIGKAAAVLFASRGWKVIGTGRRKERLDELHAELGASFLPLAFDVGERAAVHDSLSSLPDEFAAIDVLFANAGVSGMIRRGHGHVVTTGSYSATWPNPGTNVYAASKAFVRLLTYDLKEDLVGTPIRTTCIIPSVTQTEFPLARMHGDAARAARHFENLDPIQPSDIAETLWWVVNVPERITVNEIRLSPTRQTYGASHLNREPFTTV